MAELADTPADPDPMLRTWRWAVGKGPRLLDRFVPGGLVLGLAAVLVGNLVVVPAHAGLGARLFYSVGAFLLVVFVAGGAAYGWAWLRAPYEQKRVLGQMVKERDQALARKEAEVAARFSALRYSLQPGDFGAMVGEHQDAAGQRHPAYRFSVVLKNVGLDPIEFEVVGLGISVGTYTVPPGTVYGPMGGVLIAGVPQGFAYENIYAPVPPKGTLPPQGAGEYTVEYGHPSGGPKFRMHHAFAIGWVIDGAGNLQPSFTTRGRVTHKPVVPKP